MRTSDAILAALILILGGPQAAWAQDYADGRVPVPPRPIPGIALPEASSAAPMPRSIGPAPDAPAAHMALPLAPFSNTRDAIRAWMRDSTAGNQVGAVRALEYAASQGHLTAQFKLGRMYAAGEGVPANDLKAFEYFSKIADENADAIPGTADGRIVSGAFVALGSYFADGIKGSYVEANADRAFDMFHYAASYFGDPDGQYNLARLYMNGQGAKRDARQAARWMKLAAEKGHAPARAVFGDMLIRGGDGVPRSPAIGLMWLSLARDAAFAAASASDRSSALALVERQQLAGRTVER